MHTRPRENSSPAAAVAQGPTRRGRQWTRLVGLGLVAFAGVCAGAIAVAACHRAGEANESTPRAGGELSGKEAPGADSGSARNINIPANENVRKTTMIKTSQGELPIDASTGKVTLTEEQWKQRLSPEQYRILRQKGTERAFTGKEWNTDGQGEYRCAGCDNLLFTGDDKFLSDCGWPAFDKCIKGSIAYHDDRSYGMVRTEVTCARCDGHLGHIFDDGPTATGMRYCINSASIRNVQPKAGDAAKPEGGKD